MRQPSFDNFRTLINNSIVWDNHACLPLRAEDMSFMPQLERVHRCGVDVVSLNVAFGQHGLQTALTMLAALRAWLEARPNQYLLIHSVVDVQTAKDSGRLGVCFDVEGMQVLEGSVAEVRTLYDLGVRWMLAAYNQPNAAGGGCLAYDAGLTDFGRRVITEMNATGMVVCGSHCGYRTARELIDASAAPVIFSHSNPLALRAHPRNIPDDLMIACAARGGVVGIAGFGPFLGENDASTATFVAHVEYALDLIGEEHVGIGLDYVFDRAELDTAIARDPLSFPPEFYSRGAHMVEPWRLPEIAQALAARGHSRATLQKVFGGNHLRIARQVWR